MSITYESTVNSHHDRLSTITIKNIREDGEDIHVTNCLQLYFISPVEMDKDSVYLNSSAKCNIEVSSQQVVPKGAYEICYSLNQ